MTEMGHCEGCGEDYYRQAESHIGHDDNGRYATDVDVEGSSHERPAAGSHRIAA